MRKILLAIDGSACSSRAVAYCGKQFAGVPDLSVALLHVLPNLPAQFWDDGHILSEQEKEAREKVVATWLENRKLAAEPMFRAAMEELEQSGIRPEQIERKTIYDSTDVTTSILEEARDGGYLTLILGRCGPSGIGGHLLGSTTGRIVQRGAGLTICVVE